MIVSEMNSVIGQNMGVPMTSRQDSFVSTLVRLGKRLLTEIQVYKLLAYSNIDISQN